MSIKIDNEFKSLIPPLSDDEYRQLEDNCVREGIRDALVVWPQPDGDEILIDGHNRFRIAAEHSGLPFRTKAMSFEGRDEAKIWILQNQLGRRNLNTYNRGVIALQLEETQSKIAKKTQGTRTDLVPKLAQSCEPQEKTDFPSTLAESNKIKNPKTRDIIAKMAGTSHGTLDKIKAIEHSDNAPVKEAARRGDISISNAYQQVVREKTPVPPKPTSTTIEAKQRHAEFEQKKSEGVVSIQDARQDKDDQRKIGEGLYRDLISWIAKGYWIGALNNSKDFDRLKNVIPDGEIKDLREKISKITVVLDKFMEVL